MPSVDARLPFPETAAEFRSVRDGQTTSLNAVVRPSRDSVDRVPDRGDVEDASAEARAAISERLSDVE